MSETRNLVTILVADVVGYSRLAGTKDRALTRLRGLRSDLIDPAMRRHVRRTGDGLIVEFRSVVDAARGKLSARAPGLLREIAWAGP